MVLFSADERAFAAAVARLAYENPFGPGRIDCERAALGADFSEAGSVWTADEGDLPPPEDAVERPNVVLLRQRSIALADACRRRIEQRAPSDEDLALYDDLVLYALFSKYERALYPMCIATGDELPRVSFYKDFARDFARWRHIDCVRLPSAVEPAHAFAVFFQIRRAFHYIFRVIFGSSSGAAKLRVNVWQSVFTHDLRRYRDGVYARMHDVPTLVTGPSGTGKDLVAQAIGLSRFVPFDGARLRFVEAFGPQYHALSLSALSPTLVESELFGHKKGAFTGALEDRRGWLEACGPSGTVFLDEIGELDGAIQVKLLRVLQNRVFQRIGETQGRTFAGKIVAATNRDLAVEMASGRFRNDLYYRLCADQIATPTLRERIDADPEELPTLVRLLSRRIAGDDAAPKLTLDVLDWIRKELGEGYAWPGNVRELEQCIRNVMIRRVYRPAKPRAGDGLDTLDSALLASGLDADALIARYCTRVYAETGSYVETGRRLGLDRRTVKERIDEALLAAIQTGR